jgi:hypothetical protein
MMDLASIIAEPARGGEAPAPLGQSRGVIEAHECISQASAPMPRISASRAHSPHWALDVMLVFPTVRP